MERALRLIASGVLTIAVAATMKGRKIDLPSTFNDSAGSSKDVNQQTHFNETVWGKATRKYAISAAKLTKVKFDAVIQAAEPFAHVKSNRAGGKTSRDITAVGIESDDDERTCLVEAPESGDDGKNDCKSL